MKFLAARGPARISELSAKLSGRGPLSSWIGVSNVAEGTDRIHRLDPGLFISVSAVPHRRWSTIRRFILCHLFKLYDCQTGRTAFHLALARLTELIARGIDKIHYRLISDFHSAYLRDLTHLLLCCCYGWLHVNTSNTSFSIHYKPTIYADSYAGREKNLKNTVCDRLQRFASCGGKSNLHDLALLWVLSFELQSSDILSSNVLQCLR